MRLMRNLPGPASGFSLFEFLVALIVFSIAVSGALTAQLDAMSGTRETLNRMAALRILSDLANRDGVSTLTPRVMRLEAAAGAQDLPPLLAAWAADASNALPPARDATLCIARDAALVTLALAWGADNAADDCDAPGKRVRLLVASP